MEISTLSIIFLHANISDKWKRGQLNLEQMKKKGKVKVKSWIRYLAACSIQKMRWDIWRIFFQTLEASFPYKGVFFTKVVNANIIAFKITTILKPVVSVKNTPIKMLAHSATVNFELARPQIWHFGCSNKDSETTSVIQGLPKYDMKDVWIVNLSCSSTIMANFWI